MVIRRTILACLAVALACVAVRWFGCVSQPGVRRSADPLSSVQKPYQRTARTFDLPVTISGTGPVGTGYVVRTWGDLNASGTVDLFDAAKLQQGWCEWKIMKPDPLFEPKAKSLQVTWIEMCRQWRGPLEVIR